MHTGNLNRTMTTKQLIEILSLVPPSTKWRVDDLNEWGETSISLADEDEWNQEYMDVFHDLVVEFGHDEMPDLLKAREEQRKRLEEEWDDIS